MSSHDDHLTFAYEQADRKHRTGQTLHEAEWEALLAGERAARAEAEDRAHEAEDERCECRDWHS